MLETVSTSTEATLTHHLNAFANGDIDAIISDYSEESVLFTPAGAIRGVDQLRSFFNGFVRNLPDGFMDSFDMVRKDVDGEVAYIVWQSGNFAPLGTDTFVVRDGKIVAQTFTAYTPN